MITRISCIFIKGVTADSRTPEAVEHIKNVDKPRLPLFSVDNALMYHRVIYSALLSMQMDKWVFQGPPYHLLQFVHC